MSISINKHTGVSQSRKTYPKATGGGNSLSENTFASFVGGEVVPYDSQQDKVVFVLQDVGESEVEVVCASGVTEFRLVHNTQAAAGAASNLTGSERGKECILTTDVDGNQVIDVTNAVVAPDVAQLQVSNEVTFSAEDINFNGQEVVFASLLSSAVVN